MTTENSQLTATLSPNTGQAIAPARTEKGEIFNVTIRQIAYGYIVEVGCRTFAIEDSGRLIDLLGRYLKSPNEVYQQYLDGVLFQKPTE